MKDSQYRPVARTESRNTASTFGERDTIMCLATTCKPRSTMNLIMGTLRLAVITVADGWAPESAADIAMNKKRKNTLKMPRTASTFALVGLTSVVLLLISRMSICLLGTAPNTLQLRLFLLELPIGAEPGQAVLTEHFRNWSARFV